MPYCPKCDMEFIEGITVCSDCGGPLVQSKEEAEAIKQKEREEALNIQQQENARQIEEYEAWQKALEEAREQHPEEAKALLARDISHVYVKKSQQYDDLKSSASAFFLVGGALLAVSLLCWANILKLPLGLPAQIALTVLSLAALLIAIKTVKSAKTIQGQIDDEEKQIKETLEWFTDSYTGDKLDNQLHTEYGKDLDAEELSLKRYELIQDILITGRDISDQSFADFLAEEIYPRLYRD